MSALAHLIAARSAGSTSERARKKVTSRESLFELKTKKVIESVISFWLRSIEFRSNQLLDSEKLMAMIEMNFACRCDLVGATVTVTRFHYRDLAVPPDLLRMSRAVYLQHLSHCHVVLSKKSKAIALEQVHNCTIILLAGVVSTIDITHCTNLTLLVRHGNIACINVDDSPETSLVFAAPLSDLKLPQQINVSCIDSLSIITPLAKHHDFKIHRVLDKDDTTKKKLYTTLEMDADTHAIKVAAQLTSFLFA